MTKATEVYFVNADRASREELLQRLQDDAVQEACLAFYALSDVTFCHSLINLHQAKKPVRVVIDRQWIRSCPIAIECAKLLVDAGVPVYHRKCMTHYKLLTLTYADTIFASAGSANLTAAAWNRNDEFLVQPKGPPG
ncbi:hypothetical protein PC110_g16793 [Phytophthora cactorum]|nr:hypothetical protein PC110_g16793 [Phytophthora cactorum]